MFNINMKTVQIIFLKTYHVDFFLCISVITETVPAPRCRRFQLKNIPLERVHIT